MNMLHARALSRLAVVRGGVPARRWLSSTKPSPSMTSKSKSGVFKTLWTKYNVLLETKPIPTKVVTACGIAALGDIGCQLVIEKAEKLDAKRAGIFTVLGGVVVAPILHFWYGFMNAKLPGIQPKTVAKRLVLDQLGFTPVFMPIFFGILLALEGRPQDLPDKLRQDLWPTLQTNWMVWVPAQTINFTLVPMRLQVLFANTVSVFWNAYLSYVTHRAAVADDHEHAADVSETETETESEDETALVLPKAS